MKLAALASNSRPLLDAIKAYLPVAEYSIDGKFLAASETYLQLFGYGSDELVGQDQALLLDSADCAEEPYRRFWAALARGESQDGTYRRLGKDSREIWVKATFVPVRGLRGRPYKVVEIATDVTAEQSRLYDLEAQLTAIDKSQAVAEFTPDGTVIGANPNLLSLLGYRAGRDRRPQSLSLRGCRRAVRRGLRRLLGASCKRKFPDRRVQAHRQGRPRRLSSRDLQPDLRSTWPSDRRSSSMPPM